MQKNEKNRAFTSLEELGLDNLMNRVGSRESKLKPVVKTRLGQRVQVRQMENSTEAVVTSQAQFMDSIHFDLTYTPLSHLGSKWITAICSRLLASGVYPDQILIGLAVPNMVSVEMIDAILDGMDRHPIQVSVEVIEIGPSRNHLTSSIFAMGRSHNFSDLIEGNVEKGDLLCVTGDVGGAMAGLRILLREKKYWQPQKGEPFQPDLSGYEHVIGKQLLPVARLDLIEALRESGIHPRAMIDLSQGLMNDLQILGDDASCGFNIFTPAIPIDLSTRKVADEMQEDVDRYALYGGEDYEMLFTLQEGEVEKLRGSFEDFSVIGDVTDQANGIIVNDGERGTVDSSTGA